MPVFPLISIYDDCSLEIIPSESCFSKISTSDLVNNNIGADTILFDKNGNKWHYQQVSSQFKNSFLTRILALTVYNPKLDSKVIWTKCGSYDLAELKELLNELVDIDDDIITQFEEADVIKQAISQAQSFEAIVKVLNKYVFEVNEMELREENMAKMSGSSMVQKPT